MLDCFLRFHRRNFNVPQRLGGPARAPGGATGAKETRTPNIQLAKLALYQLSYNPDSYGPEWT